MPVGPVVHRHAETIRPADIRERPPRVQLALVIVDSVNGVIRPLGGSLTGDKLIGHRLPTEHRSAHDRSGRIVGVGLRPSHTLADGIDDDLYLAGRGRGWCDERYAVNILSRDGSGDPVHRDIGNVGSISERHKLGGHRHKIAAGKGTAGRRSQRHRRRHRFGIKGSACNQHQRADRNPCDFCRTR